MRPPSIDGVTYNKEFVTSLRESCITLRDAGISAGRFDWVVPLSHVIAFMALMIEELEA